MPHYEVFHTYPLPAPQRTHLAQAITNLHCTTFAAPSAFVNVTFHYHADKASDDQSYTRTMYVGGQETSVNYIVGHLRPRENNGEKLKRVVESLTEIWNDVVKPERPGWLADKGALHTVFLMEDIAAGAEQGLVLPVAGQDAGWAEANKGEFDARAKEGDESMVKLLAEMERGIGQET